jgi:hypothetical protein
MHLFQKTIHLLRPWYAITEDNYLLSTMLPVGMKIFGCNPRTMLEIVKDFCGMKDTKEYSVWIYELPEKAGVIELHPCRTFHFIYDSKSWITICSHGKTIDYEALFKRIETELNITLNAEVYKSVNFSYHVSQDGGTGHKVSSGDDDIIVIY